MASSKPQGQLGQVLIDFSTNGTFPEEEVVSAAYAEPSVLPSALIAVRDAKTALEVGSKLYSFSSRWLQSFL
jgi:centromere/kinetochore protein ZW10